MERYYSHINIYVLLPLLFKFALLQQIYIENVFQNTLYLNLKQHITQ